MKTSFEQFAMCIMFLVAFKEKPHSLILHIDQVLSIITRILSFNNGVWFFFNKWENVRKCALIFTDAKISGNTYITDIYIGYIYILQIALLETEKQIFSIFWVFCSDCLRVLGAHFIIMKLFIMVIVIIIIMHLMNVFTRNEIGQTLFSKYHRISKIQKIYADAPLNTGVYGFL